MYRLNFNFLVLIIFIVSGCKAQDKKTVYILFEEKKQVNCIEFNSNNRKDKSTSTYIGLMTKSGSSNTEVVFSMCNEKLFLIKNINPEKVSKVDFNKLDLVQFDYLVDKYIKSDMFSKRYVFDKIYFLEKINEKEYLKYGVYWSHGIHRGIQN